MKLNHMNLKNKQPNQSSKKNENQENNMYRM